MAAQINVINAAIAAGIKRFIPSDFGSDTTNPKACALPVYRESDIEWALPRLRFYDRLPRQHPR